MDRRQRQITYDDILSSLNMTVVNGKLVINRNVQREKELANIPVQPVAVAAAAAIETPPPPQNPLLVLQENLRRKKEKSKMFLLDEVKSNPSTNLKKMLI